MTSAIAILTFRRQAVLQAFMTSLAESGLAAKYPIAIFEDCGNFDDTVGWLTESATPEGFDEELNSFKFTKPGIEIYVGARREGVAGQSNKALRWFERNSYDHLCLCNDDLMASGDFVEEYAAAHTKLGIDFFEFCDFEDDLHKAAPGRYKGQQIRIITRMVGIMLSITKRVVKEIGYFDHRFGVFGEEHSDYNNRARMKGYMNLNGRAQVGVDIVSKFLAHQETASSVMAHEKPRLDYEAAQIMGEISREFFSRELYRPYRLKCPRRADGYGGSGILTAKLDVLGYQFIPDYAPHPVL